MQELPINLDTVNKSIDIISESTKETRKELEFLQDIVNMYLDIAENRAKRQIPYWNRLRLASLTV